MTNSVNFGPYGKHSDFGLWKRRLSFGFIFDHPVSVPINLREYYVSLELLKRNHRVLWLCGQQKGNYAFAHKIPQICARSKEALPGNIYIYPFYLSCLLARHRINCIWLSGWWERYERHLFYIALILKRLGYKLVYDPVDPIYEYSLEFGDLTSEKEAKLRRFANKIYKISNLTLTTTDELKQLLIRNGAPSQKIHVGWWGTDTERFKFNQVQPNLKQEYGLDGKFIIGWLGSMTPFKGIEEIMIPLFRMIKAVTNDVCFLVGGRGPLESRFFSLAKELNDSFVYLGEVPYDLAPAFTKALDIYVVPVKADSDFSQSIRPIKIFDALAAGTVLVVTATKATMALSQRFKCIQYAEPNIQSFFQTIMNTRKNFKHIKELSLSEASKAEIYSHQETSRIIVDLLENRLG